MKRALVAFAAVLTLSTALPSPPRRAAGPCSLPPGRSTRRPSDLRGRLSRHPLRGCLKSRPGSPYPSLAPLPPAPSSADFRRTRSSPQANAMTAFASSVTALATGSLAFAELDHPLTDAMTARRLRCGSAREFEPLRSRTR